MRIVVAVAVLCITASCASEKLEQGPPPGVDFSGHWKLNEADSDEPQRLIQAPDPSQVGPAGGGSQGGRQGGGRGGAGGMGYGVPGGPMMPSLGALAAGLRWPGKQLEIKQVGAVLAFTSDGNNVVCQPMAGPPHSHTAEHDAAQGTHGTHSRSREMPPPRCGWIEKTLIVKTGDPEDGPPFEQHFSLSDDGRRLVEVVDFKGGSSTGFTVSRVWDRIG